MNTSNNITTNPSSSRQQGFRSGPIRNVGGGPPPLSSGLAVGNINRTSLSAVGPSHGGFGGGSHLGPTSRSSSSSTARPTPPLVAAPHILPSAVARHPHYDAKPVQLQPPPPAFTPDNSAQLQPHVVSLPPSPTHQPSPQQQHPSAAAPSLQHPLQPSLSSMPQQQQQQGLHQARSDHPAAELQRRFYPQHYNNNQQQQAVSSNVGHQQPTTLLNQQQQQQLSQTVTTTAAQQQQQQQVSSTMNSQPHTQQQQTPIQRTKQQQQVTTTTPPTPDEDLDNFLSTGLTDSASGISYTRPKPLPLTTTTGVLSKTKLLAQRRAWGDVIRVTNDALIVRNIMDGEGGGSGGGGIDVGKHHSFYSEIVSCAMSSSKSGDGTTSTRSSSIPNNNSPTKASSQTVGGGGGGGGGVVATTTTTTATASSPNEIEEIQKLRRETCELIVLRFMAHLKLRRYVDLGKEVSMLGLMPFLPDAVARRVVVDCGPSISVGDKEGDSANENNTNTNNDNNNDNNSLDINNNDNNPLSWKEGSIHSTEPNDILPPWIPYGLRILAAQQLQYNDGSSKALDVLLDMRDRAIRTEYWNTTGIGGMACWKSTIDNAIVNTCVSMKEWRLALYHLEELISGLDEGVDREVLWWCRQDDLMGSIGEKTRSELRELITSAASVELLSRQILILLQLGAIKAAEIVQGDVRLHTSKVGGIVFTGALSRIHREFALVRQTPVREMVNDGLILVAQSDYELAAKRFRDAMELEQKIITTAAAAADNNNNNNLSTLKTAVAPSSLSSSSPPGCPSWKDLDSPTLGFDADPSLTVECINNLSLCLLYSGNMRAAVQEMETLIRKDPCEYLTEGMAFNLCTLYELGSDGEECTRRKKRLQRVAKRFFLHDIGVESFRLN
ncbi:hypothetical protein ACHAXM_011011 [Skeletonema potamos]